MKVSELIEVLSKCHPDFEVNVYSTFDIDTTNELKLIEIDHEDQQVNLMVNDTGLLYCGSKEVVGAATDAYVYNYFG